MTAGTRFKQRPSRVATPLADPSVDRLHALLGKVVRVRGMRPGYKSYTRNAPEPPDVVQDITGRIIGVRSTDAGLVEVGFDATGYVTYRISSLVIKPTVGDWTSLRTSFDWGFHR